MIRQAARPRHLLMVALLGALAIAASVPRSEVSVAVRDVSPDATQDNGQRPLVVAPDGTMYIAYNAPDAGVDAVFVARSADDGESWTVETRLSREGISARLAALAAAPDGSVHAAWVDFDTVGHVWYSVREGGTWTEPFKISPGPFYAGFPALAATESEVHLVWYAAPPDEAYEHGSRYEIIHIFDRGSGFSDPVVVSTNSVDALNPAIISDRAGGVHTAWYQLDQQAYRTHYARWAGAKWEIPRAVSPLATDATGVAIDVGPDGAVHLVWEQTADSAVAVTYSVLRDNKWSEPLTLSPGGALDPVVATDDTGRVFVAWARDGMIESRVHDGDWGSVVGLGAGDHPAMAPGDPVRIAWTRPAGDGHEIVVGPVTLGDEAGNLLPWVAITVTAVLLVGAVGYSMRRSATGRADA